MRSHRTTHDEMAAITRRRLELLGAELAGLRGELAAQTGHPLSDGPDPGAATRPDPGPDAADVAPPRLELVGSGAPGAGGPGRHARRPVGLAGRSGGWVHDRLPPTLQGRVQLSPAHLSVVALMVAVALAVTSWWVVRADGRATVVPAAASPGTSSGGEGRDIDGAVTALVTPAVQAGPPAASEPAVVVVDVTGKVRRPGIVELPLGARVVDALEAAGGARRGVDLATVNLARVLVDGEQIVVGIPPPGGVAAAAASAPAATSAGTSLMVNLNTATQAELEELPGVGPVTATSILQWRSEHGPFTAVDELMEVSGIGEATLAEIAPHVTL